MEINGIKANLALTFKPPWPKYINKNLPNYRRHAKFAKVKRDKYKLQRLHKVKNNTAAH